MKIFGMTALVTLVASVPALSAAQQDRMPDIEGDYLGQDLPGLTPELFAPGIVSTEDWSDAGRFSPDMNKFHVSRWRSNGDDVERASSIFVRTEAGWRETDGGPSRGLPFYSPDAKTRYFGRRYQVRTGEGWSELESIGSAFEEYRVMSLSVSARGTYVFDEVGTNGNGILRYSRLVDGKREDPKAFGAAINTGTWNAHPFIAPDESFILWDGERASGFGSSDIYVSFREEDGSWSEAVNLGSKVNTAAEEGGAQLTPDGKYLFFNRMVPSQIDGGEPQSDLFWVDARIIEELRPKS